MKNYTQLTCEERYQISGLRDERQLSCINGKKFSLHDWAEVERLTQQDFSPGQMAYQLELEDGLQIGHETIYQHIYADNRRGSVLWRHLRCQKPLYFKIYRRHRYETRKFSLIWAKEATSPTRRSRHSTWV
jgi:IS30 family transposase